jgi:hypothetical protein
MHMLLPNSLTKLTRQSTWHVAFKVAKTHAYRVSHVRLPPRRHIHMTLDEVYATHYSLRVFFTSFVCLLECLSNAERLADFFKWHDIPFSISQSLLRGITNPVQFLSYYIRLYSCIYYSTI